MIKHEYSVEEVRAIADNPALLWQERYLINELADLREQIERAKAGVTDEIVESFVDLACAFKNDEIESVDDLYAPMREKIQAVAHLLPSQADAQPRVPDGRVVDECVRDLRNHAKQVYDLPKLADDLRRLANCIERKLAADPHSNASR